MDAIARYLQQGETKFHPFQVRGPAVLCQAQPAHRIPTGHCCENGHHVHLEQRLHVVDESA